MKSLTPVKTGEVRCTVPYNGFNVMQVLFFKAGFYLRQASISLQVLYTSD